MDNVNYIEHYNVDEKIYDLTFNEREKMCKKIFKDYYTGNTVKYFINGKFVDALIDDTTKNNFFAPSHKGHRSETRRALRLRCNIACNGEYLNLIGNMKYKYSKKELKEGQNAIHSSKNVWHYFTKYIVCKNHVYEVTSCIRENKNKYYLHNTKLKEVDETSTS